MNQRIQELLKQAGVTDNWNKADWYSMNPEMIEKFADMIVQECVGICKGKTDHLDPNMYEVWRGALACASDIKVHFGIEP